MATTVAALVERTRRYLGGAGRVTLNRLNGSITSGAPSLVLEFDTKGVIRGSHLGIGDELLHVWDVTPGTKSVSVERGYAGSTAATHADDALVEVNPRFSRFDIKQALLDDIRSWPPDLFDVATVTLTGSLTSRAYDLAGTTNTSVLAVLDVQRQPYVTAEVAGSTSWKSTPFRFQRDLPTGDFASGSALFLEGTLDEAVDLQVVYAQAFDLSAFDDVTDVEADVGLTSSMTDIPVYGAAWRLLSGQEAERSNVDRQGDPRNADEVAAGSAITTAAAFKRLRDQRVAEEAARLMNFYPVRF